MTNRVIPMHWYYTSYKIICVRDDFFFFAISVYWGFIRTTMNTTIGVRLMMGAVSELGEIVWNETPPELCFFTLVKD